MLVELNLPSPQHEAFLNLMLDRTHIDLELILEEAIKRFINNNLDVLSQYEIQEFAHILDVKSTHLSKKIAQQTLAEV